jgi:gamma-glutamylcyclotransferase (GGCT)/AIG2-like uncharacterized protein YtfP
MPTSSRSVGQKFHPVIIETGNPADEVRGTLFLISEVELAAADAYEASDYKRVQVTLKSGRSAWVYAKARVMTSLPAAANMGKR